MKAKRDYTKSPRRSGGDRRCFTYTIITPEKRIKARRIVPDRRNLLHKMRQAL